MESPTPTPGSSCELQSPSEQRQQVEVEDATRMIVLWCQLAMSFRVGITSESVGGHESLNSDAHPRGPNSISCRAPIIRLKHQPTLRKLPSKWLMRCNPLTRGSPKHTAGNRSDRVLCVEAKTPHKEWTWPCGVAVVVVPVNQETHNLFGSTHFDTWLWDKTP